MTISRQSKLSQKIPCLLCSKALARATQNNTKSYQNVTLFIRQGKVINRFFVSVSACLVVFSLYTCMAVGPLCSVKITHLWTVEIVTKVRV